jgi:hypothetical protein
MQGEGLQQREEEGRGRNCNRVRKKAGGGTATEGGRRQGEGLQQSEEEGRGRNCNRVRKNAGRGTETEGRRGQERVLHQTENDGWQGDWHALSPPALEAVFAPWFAEERRDGASVMGPLPSLSF